MTAGHPGTQYRRFRVLFISGSLWDGIIFDEI